MQCQRMKSFFNAQGKRVFYDVLFNMRNALIEGQKELNAMAEIGKFHKNNMRDKNLLVKAFLIVTAKEHAPLTNLENNDTHEDEDLVDGDACEKCSTLKAHAYLKAIVTASSRELITTSAGAGLTLS